MIYMTQDDITAVELGVCVCRHTHSDDSLLNKGFFMPHWLVNYSERHKSWLIYTPPEAPLLFGALEQQVHLLRVRPAAPLS